jgi:hypothetical protein
MCEERPGGGGKKFRAYPGKGVERRGAAPTMGGKLVEKRGSAVKYVLMMFGDADTMMVEQPTEWVREMIAWMDEFNAELTASGELVTARGLAFPREAKTVSLVDGQVVVTDGPFAESKEALAGFWILDVRDEARGIELASRVVRWAGRVELRASPDQAPEV